MTSRFTIYPPDWTTAASRDTANATALARGQFGPVATTRSGLVSPFSHQPSGVEQSALFAPEALGYCRIEAPKPANPFGMDCFSIRQQWWYQARADITKLASRAGYPASRPILRSEQHRKVAFETVDALSWHKPTIGQDAI